jgi:hypothetical protein
MPCPPSLSKSDVEATTEDDPPDKVGDSRTAQGQSQRYLSEKALETFSPKMLRMMTNIKASAGRRVPQPAGLFLLPQPRGSGCLQRRPGSQRVAGVQAAKEANQWVEDPSLDPEKPAFAFYTGNEDAEQREYMRQIFNRVGFSDNFPPSLKASVESKPKRKLCLFMITAAGC